MIRHAVPSDKPALIGMARNFLDAVPQPGGKEFCPLSTVRTIHAAMQSGLVLVLDLQGVKGALVAMMQPMPFSAALATQELVFWIEPGFRGRWAAKMIRHFEAWAKDRGAVLIGVAARDDRVLTLYGRMGFEPAERIMTKEI